MATVFRKTYTQHLPKHVEIVERRGKQMAMWLDRRGKKRYDEITTGKCGETKLVRRSPTWFARYRDADGIERIKTTKCKDEQAARQVLADLVKRVEHCKAGIITVEQERQSFHADKPIANHIKSYLEHLKAKTVRGKRVSAHHRCNVKYQLERVVAECGFSRVGDISREAMERWMNQKDIEGMGGRTRNTHRSSIVAFCNWCVESGRLGGNPLLRLHKADENSDRRHNRRALTEEEIARLLKAAELRPIAEFGRLSTPKPEDKKKGRSTWTKAELTFDGLDDAYKRGLAKFEKRPERIADLKFIGQQRRLAYHVMICTGLRKSELASITVGQLYLDEQYPYIELLAKDEKAGRGATISLRADLVAELREYLKALRSRMKKSKLSHDVRVFRVTADMIRIFDRDLAAANIAKQDERGRVVDLHALRHTFGTHLARAGVIPRVAMAAMRHSSLNLTMNVYTDPVLLDVAGAVESLPSFGFKAQQQLVHPPVASAG